MSKIILNAIITSIGVNHRIPEPRLVHLMTVVLTLGTRKSQSIFLEIFIWTTNKKCVQ